MRLDLRWYLSNAEALTARREEMMAVEIFILYSVVDWQY